MRVIGHVPNERSATVFSDYLVVQGIANQVESDSDGWAIWIHSEDELGRSREMLDRFLVNPGDPVYQQQAAHAESIRHQRRQEAEAGEQRHFHRRRLFGDVAGWGAVPLTAGLIGACVVVGALTGLGRKMEWLQYLLLSIHPRGLPEIARGEVWRLVTPVLVHFGFLHLAFNMLWLFDLGSMIERRLGMWRLARMILVLGMVSNVGQYMVSGPLFGGMSGVVYGLLGYVWMKGRFDPGSGLFLHPQTVAMMLIWFVVCLTGWLGNIANTAHAVGLVLGIAWGYVSSRRSPSFGG
ncbi:MAG: rhomboid family intramembrane serine protease [Verrucomicrobia bacterium]|nr:rhomboid family intramembrane serine protease [Verrucomicrobiota bacterium]